MEVIKKYGFWVIILALLAYFFYINKQNQPGLHAGEMAPSFEFQALDGNSYDNSSFDGNYVLIDFWGSWCRPCVAANSELKQLYKEVEKSPDLRQNFMLVSIGYEEDSTAWLNAIEKQKLRWPIHAMEKQQGRSPMTRAFEINAFPTNFLLNPKGRIVSVNVSPTEVLRRLKDM